MTFSALIVAAGSGSRAGGDKQWRSLGGKPVLRWSAEALLNAGAQELIVVIAPDAQAKLFVTAAPDVRAARRWKQLTARGIGISFEDMLADIKRRDDRDAGRGAAPMAQAEDAVLLDTTDMGIEAAFDAARRIVEAARAKHGL